MSKQNLGGVIIENYIPFQQIELVVKKGLRSNKLVINQDGIQLPKKHIKIAASLLLNEKPPVVAYTKRDPEKPKNPASLLINYFDGKQWNEFANIKKDSKEAEIIAMKLNEKLATIHFS